MPGSISDVVATGQRVVVAINNLSETFSSVFPVIPIPLSALSTDTYATGTWTPQATFATPGDLAVVYSTAATGQIGDYVMWGSLVYARWSLITTTFTFTTSSGSFRITGLPFTSADNFQSGGSFAQLSGFTGFDAATHTFVNPRVAGTASFIDFVQMGTTPATTAVSTSSFTTGTNLLIRGNVTYTKGS